MSTQVLAPQYDSNGTLIGYEVVGGILDDAWGGIKKGVSAVGKVTGSGAFKAFAGGLALVAPPVGAPLAATVVAVEAAKKIVAATKSPKKGFAAVAAKVVQRTAALSKAGNPAASRALAMMSNASKVEKVKKQLRPQGAHGAPLKKITGPKVQGHLVTRVQGRPVVMRGQFVRVG